MDEMIACCGIRCDACPALKATLENDDELRRKTAKQWSEEFKDEIRPEHLNCVGCTVEGAHISHWDECRVRKCAQERQVETCAHCEDYVCAELGELFKMVPAAQQTLEQIRQSLSD